MSGADLGTILRRLRLLFERSGQPAPSDAELLARFVAQRDEAAFELLVWRHGPLVLNLCRRLLGREHDAEDAFQATFLTLARRAHTIGRKQSVGSWLFKVAYRIALRVRERARQQVLLPLADHPEPACVPPDRPDSDVRALLAEEVNRLPEKYRATVVLCYLQGKTNAEAAQELACPRGTIDSRLAWARQRLRRRLERRGVTLSLAGLAGLFADATAPAAVPIPLVRTTAQLALLFAARAAGGLASVPAVQLAQGVLRTMFLAQLKHAFAMVLVLSAIATGSWGWLWSQSPAGSPVPGGFTENPAALPPAPPAVKPARPERGRVAWTEQATLEDHTHGVWCVAFSPDGRLLVSGTGGTPGELRIWDAATGRIRATFATEEQVRSVAFAPDGKLFATAEFDHTAKLRDPATGAVRSVIRKANGCFNAVTFSPDGRLLATANWDRTIQLWRVTDPDPKQPFRTLEGHQAAVYSVAFSPDGRSLVSGGGDCTARVWDVAGARQRFTLAGHGDVVEFVAFAPDGQRVATASWDKTVKLWDAKTGKELATLRGHTQQVLCVAFSPDGKTLASSSGRWGDHNYTPGPGEIILWDIATGAAQATQRGHRDRIFTVAFSPDGKRLASASWDQTVKIWTPDRGPGRPEGFLADRLDQLLDQLVKSGRPDEQVGEALYLATLGRLPTDGERRRFGQRARVKGRRDAIAELRGILTDSEEFRLHLKALQECGARRSPE